MSGDGIRYYAGEFLVSPAGLELSMNWCGHDCSYCFANATVPNRRADLSGIMGLLANYKQRETREAKLLQAGVPMLVSNHVDPFAGTNAEQFEPIWEVCVEAGVNLTWQTRGAHKPQRKILERVIRETPRSTWYISIPFLDDEVRKLVEPKAPSVGSRLELIDELIAAGHVVTVGVNPLSIEWLPDYEPLLDQLKASGVWGVWVQVPYFAQTFKGKLRRDQVEALTPEFIQRCGEKGNVMDLAHAAQCMEYAKSIGLEVFSTEHEEPSRYFEPWHEVYGTVMPYWHQVINEAAKALGPDDDYVSVTKEAALAVMEKLPDGIDWAKLLHRKSSNAFRKMIGQETGPLPKFNVEQFWNAIWNEEYFSRSFGLLSLNCFAYAATVDKEEIVPVVDDNGDRVMVYRPNGWQHLYAHTPELVAE